MPRSVPFRCLATLDGMNLSLRDRGATDPLLIIAGIAISLILLVGGSFALAEFMSYSRDMAARDDLARIATAEVSYHSENDHYAELATGPDIELPNTQLADGKVGFTPSENNTVVSVSKSGWTAVTQSASGKVFVRSSFSRGTYEVEGKMAPAPDALGPRKLLRTNLAIYPDGYYSKSTNEAGFGFEASRWASDGNYRNIIDAPDGPDGLNVSSYLRWSAGAGAVSSRQYGFNLAGDVDSPFVPTGAAKVTAGDTLTASMFFRASTNASSTMRLRFATETGWLGGIVTGTPSQRSNGEWVMTSMTFKVPAGATKVALSVDATAGIVSGGTLDGSALLVEKAESVQAYIDGDSYDFPTVKTNWTGQKHRSTSEQWFRQVVTNREVWTPTSKPEGLELPPGITWDDVVTDLMQVKQ